MIIYKNNYNSMTLPTLNINDTKAVPKMSYLEIPCPKT